MALSKKTISKHNIKRAEVFAEHGLGDHDVAFAHPSFAGYMAGGDTDCCLCDHRHIAWQFAIRFTAPDAATALGKVTTGLIRTSEVTLKYVGSKCINDWLDAIPESKEKLEALKRWSYEMDKCKAAMRRKVVDDLCAKAGFEDAAGAYDAYKALPWHNLGSTFRAALKAEMVYEKRRQLTNNAKGIERRSASRATVKTWLENLAVAIAVAESLPPPPAPKTGPVNPDAPAPAPEPVAEPQDALAKLSTADLLLLLEAREIFKAKLDGCWNSFERGAVIDIAKKVKKYGSFSTSKQRDFFAKLVKVAGLVNPAPGKLAPGDVGFGSASKVDGARY